MARAHPARDANLPTDLSQLRSADSAKSAQRFVCELRFSKKTELAALVVAVTSTLEEEASLFEDASSLIRDVASAMRDEASSSEDEASLSKDVSSLSTDKASAIKDATSTRVEASSLMKDEASIDVQNSVLAQVLRYKRRARLCRIDA